MLRYLAAWRTKTASQANLWHCLHSEVKLGRLTSVAQNGEICTIIAIHLL